MTANLLANPTVIALAVGQAGALSLAQFLSAGFSLDQIKRALRAGLITRAAPGVYVVATSPPSFEQGLWVGALAVGRPSAVSHEGAGRTLGLATFGGFASPTLLVPHGSHERVAGVIIRQTRDPWPVSMSLIHGLPVTTVERTIVDLGAVLRRGRLAIVLDDAVAAKRTSYTAVGHELRSVARRGKPGVRLLTSVLDERGPGSLPPLSHLERELMGLFDRFGGPRPRLAWPYPGRQQVNGCADAGFADALLAIEADGRRWHDRIAQRKTDIDRDHEAGRHGVQVVRLLYEHIVGDPRGTWQLVQDTRQIRLQQLKLPVLEAIGGARRPLLPPERGRIAS